MSDAWETVLQDEALFMQTNRRGVDYARSLRLMLEADSAEADEWHLDLMLIAQWNSCADQYADLPGVGIGIADAKGDLKVITLCPSRGSLIDMKRAWIADDGPSCGFGVLPRWAFDSLVEKNKLPLLIDRCVHLTRDQETLH
jgi:hypothetical protein